MSRLQVLLHRRSHQPRQQQKTWWKPAGSSPVVQPRHEIGEAAEGIALRATVAVNGP